MLPPESRWLHAERFYALVVRTLSRLADHRKAIGSGQIQPHVFGGYPRPGATAMPIPRGWGYRYLPTRPVGGRGVGEGFSCFSHPRTRERRIRRVLASLRELAPEKRGIEAFSRLAADRCLANQPLSVLGVSEGLVLGGKGLHRSGRRGAVRVDQLPVESTVTLPDDLEVGAYG
jgi:hypothetical protein